MVSIKGFIVGLLIVLFNFIDGLVTYYVVSEYNLELNPLISFYIEVMGSWFLVPKFAIGIVVGFIVYWYWNRFKVARIGGMIALLVYSLVIIYHTIGITLMYIG
jgi:hypothetical protein